MRLFPFLIPDDPGFFRIHKSRDAGQDDYAETSGMRAAGWRRRGGTTRSVRLFRAGVDDPEDCIIRTILHRLPHHLCFILVFGLPGDEIRVAGFVELEILGGNHSTIGTPVTFLRDIVLSRNVIGKPRRSFFHHSHITSSYVLWTIGLRRETAVISGACDHKAFTPMPSWDSRIVSQDPDPRLSARSPGNTYREHTRHHL